MERFSAWARWIVVGVFTVFVLPIAVEFLKHMAEKVGLYDRPGEAVDTILNFFLSLAELPWLRITALALFAFGAGLWVDWLLRKLDRSRIEERKMLGAEMVNFGETLGLIKDPTQHTPRIRSYFISARKFGIWAPDDRIFSILTDRLKSAIRENGSYMTPTKSVLDYMTLEGMIKDYLKQVGTMLRDGHFWEARQYAINSKATFDGLS